MSARFRVRDVFQVSGRGPVLSGDILEGRVKRGMQLTIPGFPNVTVASVEYVDNPSEKQAWIGLVLHNAPDSTTLREVFPPGSELELTTQAPRSAETPSTGALRRFWFPLTFGFGVGVTAPTEAEARALAEEARVAYFPPEASFTGVVIPDIDVRTLDAGQVITGVGPPAIRGVWYPKLNI